MLWLLILFHSVWWSLNLVATLRILMHLSIWFLFGSALCYIISSLIHPRLGSLMCAFITHFREKLNSMNLLLYMSPIAVVALIPAVFIMEPNVLEVFVSLGIQHRFMWMVLLLNSVMAYSANLTNFLVTKNTSALTLQVWHAWVLCFVVPCVAILLVGSLAKLFDLIFPMNSRSWTS